MKCILYTLYITHFKNTKYFLLHAVWYEDRAIQLLKFSMSQEVKKGPFAALTFESSKNFMLRYFQKLMWFYLLVTKNSLLGKVWGKTFSDAKYPGPLLQRSPLKYAEKLLKWTVNNLNFDQTGLRKIFRENHLFRLKALFRKYTECMCVFMYICA